MIDLQNKVEESLQKRWQNFFESLRTSIHGYNDASQILLRLKKEVENKHYEKRIVEEGLKKNKADRHKSRASWTATNGPTDRRTDQRTDRRTDKAAYRVACTRLKRLWKKDCKIKLVKKKIVKEWLWKKDCERKLVKGSLWQRDGEWKIVKERWWKRACVRKIVKERFW